MKLQETLVIVNPISGTGSQAKIAEQLKKYLPEHAFRYELQFTEGPGHATRLAQQAADKAYDLVLAVGGDGTVNEVARGLIHSPTALGIIPTGSGNGLGRHLKIPSNPEMALSEIETARRLGVDVPTVNDEPFFNVAGVGYDAFVAQEFAKSKTRGLATYTQIVLGSWFSYKPKNYTLKLDGESWEGEALMVSVANGSQFGNNALIAPQAQVDDGILEVAVVQKFPLMAIPLLAKQLFSGELLQSRYTEYFRVRELEISFEESLLHLDGEPFKMDSPLQIKVKPRALNILVPKAFFNE